jgi:hypothetical protein
MKARRAHHLLAVGVLIGLACLAFSDVLGPDRGLFFRDHVLFRRRLEFVRESLLALRWPGFTPFEATGVPNESILQPIYTPATLALLSFGFDTGYDLFVVALYVILGTGAYVLALSFGARPIEALLSAAVAMLGGPVLSFENLLMTLGGIAFVPWVLWSVANLLRTGSPRWMGALAIALGFQAQGINPEYLLLDLAGFVAILAVVRPKFEVKLALMLFGAAAIGCGIAAVEIMPVLEFLPGTARGKGFGYDVISLWSMKPEQLFDFFVPAFWSPPESPIIQMPSIVGKNGFPYLMTLYLGSTIAIAAIAPLRKESRRASLALIGGGLFAVVVALGPAGLVHPLLVKLPLLSHSRYPVKYLVFLVAAVAAIMPIALRAFEAAPLHLVAAAGLQAFALGMGLTILESDELVGYLATKLNESADLHFIGIPFSEYPSLAAGAMTARTAQSLVFAILVTGTAIASAALPKARHRGPTAVALLIALDLAAAGRWSIVGAPVEPKSPPPEVMQKIASPYYRAYSLSPNGVGPAIAHRRGHTLFEDSVISDHLRGSFEAPGVRFTIDADSDALSNRISANAFALLPQLKTARARRLLARMGTAWILTPAPEDPENAIAFQVPDEQPEYLVALPNRGYVTAYTRTRLTDPTSPRDVAHALTDEDGWSTAAVYDRAHALLEMKTASTATRCRARVDLAAETKSDRIAFTTDAACDHLAVVLETMVRGWEARVDGHPAQLFTAEVGWLAVKLPPGPHAVVIEYVPRGPRWIWVSLVSLLIAAGVIAAYRRRSEREAHD